MISNIIFNNKNSVDFNLILEKKFIQPPSKKKIKIDIPFMNGFYDFSTVGSGGEVIYNQREIIVTFILKANNKKELYVNYSSVLEWLMDTGQQKLIFSDIPDYYFMAEIEEAGTFEQVLRYGRLEVIFIAEPFKKSIDYIGEDIWDTFNFLEDINQTTDFYIETSKTVNIYNAGRVTTLEIIADANFILIYNFTNYNIAIGTNNLYDFKLKNGNNEIVITGDGNIQFKLRKVRL